MVLPNPGRTHVPGQAIILARKITKRGLAKMRQGLRLRHGQAQGQSQASRITTIQFQCFNVSCFFPSLLESNWAATNAGLRAVARGVGLWQGLSSMRRGPPEFQAIDFTFPSQIARQLKTECNPYSVSMFHATNGCSS